MPDALDDPELHSAHTVAALCCDADGAHGDSVELALIAAAAAAGCSRARLLERSPETERVPFDRDIMMMATLPGTAGGPRMHMKGAPERVFSRRTYVRTGHRAPSVGRRRARGLPRVSGPRRTRRPRSRAARNAG